MRLRIPLQKHSHVLILSFTVTSLLFLAIALASESKPIRTVTGTVTRVSDGDTIQVTTPEQTRPKVRLYGIDAPETPKPDPNNSNGKIPGQPYGRGSWKALERKISGKQVRLDIVDIDRYRRMVSIVWIGDRNINLEMIKEGYAEAYREYLKPPFRSSFLSAEKEAQRGKRGVWSLPEYERPQDFRRRIFKKR